MSDERPGRGKSQLIGQDAVSAFSSSRPRRWAINGNSDADYGIDYLVTSFNENELADHVFQVQLKGTTVKSSRLADGITFSYGFDRSTLNLWHSTITPVVVVIADFIDGQDPKTAPVYYKFVSPELDEVLGGKDEDQASVVIRIPRNQVLTRELDLSSEIEKYLAEYRDARRQIREQSESSGDRIPQSPYTIPKIKDVAGTHDRVIDLGDVGLEELIKTLTSSEELGAAFVAIRQGDVLRALGETKGFVANRDLATELEQGLAEFLRFQALSLAGRNIEAKQHLNSASSLAPEVDAIRGALAQQELDAIAFGEEGAASRAELITKLESATGPSCRIVLSKLQALERNFSGARATLEGVPVLAATIPKITTTIVEGDWPRVIDEVAIGISTPGITKLQELTLFIFEARARFQLAMGELEWPDDGELTIPPSGLPGMHLDQLNNAYELCEKALLIAHGLNWPTVIGYIMDVVAISTMTLGRIDKMMPTLASLGLARAHDDQIRPAITRLALNADQPALVVQMREKAGSTELSADEELTVGVAACQMGNPVLGFKYVEAVDLATLRDSDSCLASLLMIGVAAHAASRVDILSKVTRRLNETERSKPFAAMLGATVAVKNSALSRTDALSELMAQWEDLGRPDPIARHIILNSDATSLEEAERVILVGTHMSGHAVLDDDQVLALGRAYLTKADYESAIDVLSSGYDQYQGPRLKSLLGVALELGGRPGQAFQVFSELVDSGMASESTWRYFVNGAVRFGLTEKAETLVRGQLMVTTNRDKRLQLFAMLYQIESLSKGRSDVLWGIANQYGAIANRDSEKEEGMFLQFALMSSAGGAREEIKAGSDELRERITAFLGKFPESKYFRSFELPDSNDAASLIDALNSALGITPDDQARHHATMRALERGELPVPFTWRPQKFLRNASDVLTLWHLSKSVPIENAAWHFNTLAEGIERKLPQNLQSKSVVVSLLSLLVLEELGMLELALDAFQTIVVARGTLIALQNARGLTGTGIGRDCAARILTALTGRLDRIRHPHLPPAEAPDNGRLWHDEESLAMRASDSVYYCDDILESIMVCHDNDGEQVRDGCSMSTVDLLAMMNLAGEVSDTFVSEKLARLVDLKIGIAIEQRYLLSAADEDFLNVDSWASISANDIQHCVLARLLNGVWSPSKSLEQLLDHFAGLAADLLGSGRTNLGPIYLVWERWIAATRLQEKPRMLPLQKVTVAFIATAQKLQDRGALAILWKSFWDVIGYANVAPDQRDDPDVVGTRAVAMKLGQLHGKKGGNEVADLSAKIRSALSDNSQLEGIYASYYVESSANAAIKAKQDERNADVGR
ncbi:DUF4365 domain-containing protein [Xanthomonas arboricola]|uniref:DUF4365 domain-containing protein n=1 Tax=Xanthomonas arboricola TaxID=56448 RepID=UPI003EBB5325